MHEAMGLACAVLVRDTYFQNSSKYLLHCGVHHLHLALGGSSWCDSYWIGPSWQLNGPGMATDAVPGLWLGACMHLWFWNLTTCVLASGLWHLWCLRKDKLHLMWGLWQQLLDRLLTVTPCLPHQRKNLLEADGSELRLSGKFQYSFTWMLTAPQYQITVIYNSYPYCGCLNSKWPLESTALWAVSDNEWDTSYKNLFHIWYPQNSGVACFCYLESLTSGKII